MIIKIIELCMVEGQEDKKERVVIYDSPFNEIEECLKDYKENFDSDNIISCQDNFTEECLESKIISIEKYK